MTDTVNVPREEYERIIGVAEGLIRELSDPGTEAMAAVWCARRILDEAAMLAAAPKAEPVSDPYKLEPLLWSMHILGPDDVYPAPDLETAFRWCEYVNSQLAPRTPEVLCAAIPAPWDGTAEAHANSLPDAIKGWTIPPQPLSNPQQLPEAPKVEQEPVAKIVSAHGDPEEFGKREIEVLKDLSGIPYNTPLYTHPAPASDELLPRIEGALRDWNAGEIDQYDLVRFCEAAIAKHKGPQS